MDITQWYAAAIICIALSCLLLRILSQLAKVGEQISHFLVKQLFHRYIIGRHALLGPWTLAFVLAQVAYFGVNIFCVSFNASDVSQMSNRGGTLAFINLSSLMMAFQFDWFAHALGFSLTISRKIHRSLGLNAFVLAAIHVIIAAVKDTTILLSLPKHPFLITVSQSNTLDCY